MIRHKRILGGGGRGAPAPPSLQPRTYDFYAQNAKLSQFFTLSSLTIHFKHNFNSNMPRTCKKGVLIQPSTLSMIFYTPTVDKVHAPHLRSNPGCATVRFCNILTVKKRSIRGSALVHITCTHMYMNVFISHNIIKKLCLKIARAKLYDFTYRPVSLRELWTKTPNSYLGKKLHFCSI